MLAAGSMAALLYHQFEVPGPLAVARVITVPKGEGRIEIATRLEKEGAISSRWAFMINYLVRSKLGPKPLELKAGDYEIKKNSSMAEIMETLTQGRGVLSKLTIPEGMTSLQIVEKLREQDELVGDITEIPPEGSLLPDTYRFSKGMERARAVGPHAGRDAALPRRRVGAASAEPADQDAGGGDHLRLHRREGNGPCR